MFTKLFTRLCRSRTTEYNTFRLLFTKLSWLSRKTSMESIISFDRNASSNTVLFCADRFSSPPRSFASDRRHSCAALYPAVRLSTADIPSTLIRDINPPTPAFCTYLRFLGIKPFQKLARTVRALTRCWAVASAQRL